MEAFSVHLGEELKNIVFILAALPVELALGIIVEYLVHILELLEQSLEFLLPFSQEHTVVFVLESR